MRAILPVDAAEARDVLQRLRDEGFLEQHGQRGGATYYLSGSLRPPAGLKLGPDELDDLVEGLADDGPITNSAVRQATGLDRVESLAILARLVKEGRLIRTVSDAGRDIDGRPTMSPMHGYSAEGLLGTLLGRNGDRKLWRFAGTSMDLTGQLSNLSTDLRELLSTA